MGERIVLVFKKIKDKENKFERSEVTMECDSVYLPEILENFKYFLLACGYVIRPEDEIGIISEDQNEAE